MYFCKQLQSIWKFLKIINVYLYLFLVFFFSIFESSSPIDEYGGCDFIIIRILEQNHVHSQRRVVGN